MSHSPMDRECLEFQGIVRELKRDVLIVDCFAGALRREVFCKLSGKLRQNHIRVVAGDEVTVEVSAYDLTRGRITYRGKRRES